MHLSVVALSVPAKLAALLSRFRNSGPAAWAFALALLLAPVLARADGPVIVPGSFAVGSTGAATYSVPIQVPPGTGGMVPSLSLSYSSQGGNGIVGMGWTLGGLPAVSRCPQTIAQDGATGTVTFTASDRFCLDGQRLVAINGAYGADGTEYRTEIDGFSRIVSHGTTGTGPTWFQVWTKSGQIMEFGNGFQILATGTSSVRVWAVTRISDTTGNYLTVSHGQIAATGEVWPTEIDYTGNTTTGLIPYDKVVFSYAARSDVSTQYQTGAMVQQTQVLTNIRTYTGGALVFDYRLAYQQGLTGRNRLASLTLCASDEATCLPATSFAWTADTSQPLSAAVGYPNSADNCLYTCGFVVTGDVNGDGKADLIHVIDNSSRVFTWFSNGDGTYNIATFTGSADPCLLSCGYVETGDVNGDGKTDLIHIIAAPGNQSSTRGGATTTRPTPSQVVTWLSKGDGTYNIVSFTSSDDKCYTQCGLWQVGDVAGNGKSDLIHIASDTGQVYTWLSNGDGTYKDVLFTSSIDTCLLSCGSWQAGDFNGDGKFDLVHITTNGSVYVWFSNGDGTYNVTSFKPPPNSDTCLIGCGYFIAGDVNGDGNTDLIHITNSPGFVITWMSKGDGSFALSGFTSQGDQCLTTCGNFQVADVNGDGRVDLIHTANDSGVVNTWLSNGDGSYNVVGYTNTGDKCLLSCGNVRFADVTGDGKADLIHITSNSPSLVITWPGQGQPPDLMTGITNGLTAQTQIAYAPLDNYASYTKGSSGTYPTLDYTGPLYVTSSVNQSNGAGGTNATNYLYADAQMDLSGRGFLGFGTLQSLDGASNLLNVQVFYQQFPMTGLLSESQTQVNGGGALSHQTNSYSVVGLPGPRYAVALQSSTSTAWDLDGSALPTRTASYIYDFNSAGGTSYGDVMSVTSSTSDGFSQTTTNSYGDIVSPSQWLLGRLTQSAVTSTGGGSGATITKTVAFNYDPTTGLLSSQWIEPYNGSYAVLTSYVRDGYGNITKQEVQGGDTQTRITSTVYDAIGRFATSMTNTLGQSTGFQRDPRFGTVTQTTDANYETSSSTYDGFGRKATDVAADGTRAGYEYIYYNPAQTWGIAYSAQVMPYATDGKTQSGPWRIAYYDVLGRTLINDVQGFDGTVSRLEVVYDALGNAAQQSRPFFATATSGSPQWTVSTFDILHRVTRSVAPDGTVSTHAYHGLVEVDQNANSQTLTTIRNSQGKVISVVDALGNTTRYGYDPVGDVTVVIDPAGNTVLMNYDQRGRMVTRQDPDTGIWRYGYDVLGETTQVTDNKGQVVTASYDVLGRMVSRTEPDLTSNWTYDTSAHGVGKLASATTNQGYALSLAYDGLSRPIQSTQTIGGASYSYTTAYDANGRVGSVTYPSGFVATRSYNTYGYATQEAESDSQASRTLWTAAQMDAEMHPIVEIFGNGVATTRSYDPRNGELLWMGAGANYGVQSVGYGYDAVGNVVVRNDGTQGVNEGFRYDALNRLVQAQINGAAPVTYGYDQIGNLTSKSDVGSFTYGPAGGGGPHQLLSADVSSSSPYAAAFAAGTERSYAWTSYNMAAAVTAGGQTISFSYGPSHTRLTQVSPQGTTTYLRDPISGAYEEDISAAGGAVTKNHYVKAGEVVWSVSGAGITVTPRYFHRDMLGSITALTDANGNIVEQDRYDAWGKRRYANGATDGSDAITSQTDRGYIGEESLADVGLSDLNARLYDPLTGRFVSADPIGLAGGANPYAYAGNNPMRYSDPSGLCFLGCFWKPVFKSPIFRTVAAIAVAAVGQEYALPALWGELGVTASIPAFVTAGIAGGAAGAVATGTWQGAVMSAGSAALFAGLGSNSISDGASGDGGAASGDASVPGDGVASPGGGPTSATYQGNTIVSTDSGGGGPLELANDPGVPGGNGTLESDYTDANGVQQVTISAQRPIAPGIDFSSPSMGPALTDFGWWTAKGVGSLVLPGAVFGTLGRAGEAASIVFKTAHYAPRLTAVGIDVARAEALVAEQVAGISTDGLTGGGVFGRLPIDDQFILWRANPMPGGGWNVGTIHPDDLRWMLP